MSIRTLISTLRADLLRHWDIDKSFMGNIRWMVFAQGVWATVVYRFGQWVYEGHHPLIGQPSRFFYVGLNKAVEITTGIQLPASAKIGQGFYIGHFGTIILHTHTVMGVGCSIGQGVTIGTKGHGSKGVPVIGDNVAIHAGAKVLGPIRVGNNVAIGANAVVLNDVPSDSIAVGVPARVLPKKTD